MKLISLFFPFIKDYLTAWSMVLILRFKYSCLCLVIILEFLNPFFIIFNFLDYIHLGDFFFFIWNEEALSLFYYPPLNNKEMENQLLLPIYQSLCIFMDFIYHHPLQINHHHIYQNLQSLIQTYHRASPMASLNGIKLHQHRKASSDITTWWYIFFKNV